MLKLVSFHIEAHLNAFSPSSGILFPNLLGASSERITLYNRVTSFSVEICQDTILTHNNQ